LARLKKIVKDERASFFPLSISDEEKKSFATNGPTRRQQNGGKSFFLFDGENVSKLSFFVTESVES
jgi:hypothetical protein